MKQPPLAMGGFEALAKKTRRSAYQATMHRGLPRSDLLAVIDPYYAPWRGSSAHGWQKIDLGCEGAPDETTILKFRPWRAPRGQAILETMNT